MRRFFILLALFFIGCCLAQAQDFSGNYQIPTESGKVTITLRLVEAGKYSGEIKGNNNYFQLKGTLQDGILRGKVGEDTNKINFEAVLKGNYLSFTMIESGLNGLSDPATARTLILQRINSSVQNDASVDSTLVIINNIRLTEEQILQVESTYGVKPLPGNYWYDTKSGLYGVIGYPAFGFMLPGHNFGPISPDASHGYTGVVVNGRILPQNEWLIWSYILGYWIQPNNYWLDHMGNAGIVGVEIPLVNLFVAARQNQYMGKGASGDNFWSSRFSAGNYDSNNQRGYVSVPGYGPVGYGF